MDRASDVSIGDITLFVREIGLDAAVGSPLLVIHGGPDWDHTYLMPGLNRVARNRRVIAFDLRGCGRSRHNLGASGYQPEFIVDYIAGLIRASGRDRVDLLGFSTGGQVAQLFVGRNSLPSKSLSKTFRSSPLSCCQS